MDSSSSNQCKFKRKRDGKYTPEKPEESEEVTEHTLLEKAKKYITPDTCRTVLQAFFMGHGLLQAALDSCDHLMKTQISEIMCEKREVSVESDRKTEKITWFVDDVSISKPTVQEENGTSRLLLPDEARIRKLTYACTVNISFIYTEFKRDTPDLQYQVVRKIRYQNKPFCNFPVMVRSFYCNIADMPEYENECPHDGGGYFIINGTEKAVIMQEKMRTNEPYVSVKPKTSRFSHVCEIRSLVESKLRSTSTLYIYITAQRGGSPPHIFVQIPFITMLLPLCAMFSLLKVNKKSDMIKYVIGNTESNYLDKTMLHLVSCIMDDDIHGAYSMSYNELVQLVGKKGTNQMTNEGRTRRVQHTIINEVLPHMGLTSSEEVYKLKAHYLGYAVFKLLMIYTGRMKIDDRDDYCNKRIEPPGRLLALLYRQVYRNYLKTLQMTLKKTFESSKRLNPMMLLNHKKVPGC